MTDGRRWPARGAWPHVIFLTVCFAALTAGFVAHDAVSRLVGIALSPLLVLAVYLVGRIDAGGDWRDGGSQ